MLSLSLIAVRLCLRVTDAIPRETRIKRGRTIGDRCSTAKLTLNKGHEEILERSEPSNASFLIEDDEEIVPDPRADLTGKCTYAAIG